jgi:hypothetical protein
MSIGAAPNAIVEPAPTVSGEGTSIVERAAAILEQELKTPLFHESPAPSSAGDPLTKGPDKLAGAPGQAGRDARALVDALLRLLASGGASRGTAVGGAPTEERPSRDAESLVTDGPVFRATARARPGQLIELSIGLVNDDPDEPAEVELFCTELLAGPDLRIPEARVRLLPSGLRLQPGGSADVVIRVDVPPDAARGSYVGLLRATNLDDLQAIVALRVE